VLVHVGFAIEKLDEKLALETLQCSEIFKCRNSLAGKQSASSAHCAFGLRNAGTRPLYVATEGKLVAILPRGYADEILKKINSNEFGEKAEIIGEIVAKHAGMFVAKTGIGGTRVVDLQLGEPLPRIC
jgi:hypothetical protein